MRRALVFLVVVPALLVGLAPVARAMPLEAKRQGSNNSRVIVYDDVSGTIETTDEISGITSGEKILMWVNVVSDPAAEAGSRLHGSLRLYLRGDKAMRFAGIFKIVFLDSLTSERTIVETSDSFVLRPRAGERGRRFDYVFDLPSGAYQYFGLYKPL